MINKEVPVEVIMRMLDHSSPQCPDVPTARSRRSASGAAIRAAATQ